MGVQRAFRRWRHFVGRRTFRPQDFDDPPAWLWSKGYARHCDFRGPEDYWLAPTESAQDRRFFHDHFAGAHGLVWLRLSTLGRIGLDTDLDRFVDAALPSIDRPFVLVTTDGDISVPSELRPATVEALLGSPHLAAWYTQNHDGSGGPKLRPLPIGLDLHTPRPYASPRSLAQDLAAIADTRPSAAAQPLRIVCDLGLNPNSQIRRDAVGLLARSPHVTVVRRRVGQKAIWQRYAASPFVLSLAGNGIDCHRTWEALYLGSIVIVKRSSLDPLYAGLPVAIVDDLTELRDPANLRRWRDELAPLADPQRIRRILDAPSTMARIRAEHLGGEGR